MNTMGTKLQEKKKLKALKERLERIFPDIEMYFQPELFNEEQDCAPGYFIDWPQFLTILEENGLEIRDIKEKS